MTYLSRLLSQNNFLLLLLKQKKEVTGREPSTSAYNRPRHC